MTRTDSEQITAIAAEVAVIKSTVISLDKRLFGNGQPGHIESIYKRLAKLENWRWWVVGVAVGAGMFAGGVGHKLLEKMIP